MSSRMFLGVREAKGLAYYIQSSTDDYVDAGVISTRAGVDLKRVEDAVRGIVAEYKTVRDELVPEKELQKSKDYLKGKMVLKLEDSEEVAHLLAQHEVLFGEIRTAEDISREVDKITSEDLQRVAQDLFKEDRLYFAGIGPWEDKARFEALLKF